MDNVGDAGIMSDVVLLRPTRSDALDDDFRAVFDASYSRIVRTVFFIVHDLGSAEEVTQDAFTELFRSWRKVRTYDQPDAWVRRVAIRKAQREASRVDRRRRVERAAAHPLHVVAGGDDLPDPELMAAIRTLPPRQRAVLVLFYLEDRPMAEVADLVGCSPSTGFVQLHQARKRLAALLSQEVDGDVR